MNWFIKPHWIFVILSELLHGNTTLFFFLVVGFGFLIGKRKIGSIEVGSTSIT